MMLQNYFCNYICVTIPLNSAYTNYIRLCLLNNVLVFKKFNYKNTERQLCGFSIMQISQEKEKIQISLTQKVKEMRFY